MEMVDKKLAKALNFDAIEEKVLKFIDENAVNVPEFKSSKDSHDGNIVVKTCRPLARCITNGALEILENFISYLKKDPAKLERFGKVSDYLWSVSEFSHVFDLYNLDPDSDPNKDPFYKSTYGWNELQDMLREKVIDRGYRDDVKRRAEEKPKMKTLCTHFVDLLDAYYSKMFKHASEMTGLPGVWGYDEHGRETDDGPRYQMFWLVCNFKDDFWKSMQESLLKKFNKKRIMKFRKYLSNSEKGLLFILMEIHQEVMDLVRLVLKDVKERKRISLSN